MRSTYIIMNVLLEILLLAVMVLSPIYITPGWYIWSVLFLILIYLNGVVLTRRLDEWNEMDKSKTYSGK